MGFRAQHIVGMLFAVVLCPTVQPLRAQSTAPVGNQSILFSAPAANPLALPGTPAQAPASRAASGSQIEAPHSVFGQFGPDTPDPAMPTYPVPPQVNALQQMMREKQKDWAQMTPAEILGVPSADISPNSLTPNPASKEPYRSPLEKFLMQQRLAQTGTTNLNVPNAGWNFLDRDGLPNSQTTAQGRDGSVVRSQIFNRWLENAEPSVGGPVQDQDDAWARVFLAPQPDRPTAAQTADQEAFRQLLQPIAVAQELKNATRGRSYASSLPPADPNVEPPPAGYNPVGASFMPLQSGIGRPARLAPLPTLTSAAPAPAVIPAWAPQPPPWTLTTPQLFVNPLRKY